MHDASGCNNHDFNSLESDGSAEMYQTQALQFVFRRTITSAFAAPGNMSQQHPVLFLSQSAVAGLMSHSAGREEKISSARKHGYRCR